MNGHSEATEILAELRARGIRIQPAATRGNLWLEPKRAVDPLLLEKVRQHKAELLAHIRSEQKPTETDCLAHGDGPTPLPPTGHPAYSILDTCQRAGVALRIDPENGDLVVGKAGAKADEPTQPWVDLVRELEAHVEAVARLVESGWTLKAEFRRHAAD